jgi:hypothetical protein
MRSRDFFFSRTKSGQVHALRFGRNNFMACSHRSRIRRRLTLRTHPGLSRLRCPKWLRVQDGFLSGDRFQMFDNAVSLGLTSLPTQGADCGTDLSCANRKPRFLFWRIPPRGRSSLHHRHCDTRCYVYRGCGCLHHRASFLHRRPSSSHAPTLRHRPRRIRSARLAQEAEGRCRISRSAFDQNPGANVPGFLFAADANASDNASD